MSTLPACLQPALFERVAEGWTPDAIAAWLAQKYGIPAAASDVLITLKQATAERGAAKTMVREHMRAELPAILAELADLRSRAKQYETEAHAAGDRTAVRSFMAEQRAGIALALRYSGAADPEEPSAEAAAIVNAELGATLDRLEEGLDRATLRRVLRLIAQPVLRELQALPAH